MTKITDWHGNPASAADVLWECGTKGTYRLGYQGKVRYSAEFSAFCLCLHLLICFESRLPGRLGLALFLSVTQCYPLGREGPSSRECKVEAGTKVDRITRTASPRRINSDRLGSTQIMKKTETFTHLTVKTPPKIRPNQKRLARFLHVIQRHLHL